MLGSGGCMISYDGTLIEATYTGHNKVSQENFGVDAWKMVAMGGMRISICPDNYIVLAVNLDMVSQKAIEQLKKVYGELRDRCVIIGSEFTNKEREDHDQYLSSDWDSHKFRLREIMQAPRKQVA